MASKAENFETNSLENPDTINIKEYFQRYSIYWRWFLVGMLLSLILAFVYLRYTQPLYNASAYIMIKDNLKSGISDELKAISDLGIVGTSSTNNPENEIFIVKSRKIVGRMVDSLALNVRYFFEGEFKKEEAYTNSPYQLKFLQKDSLFYETDTTFIISKTKSNTLLLKNTDDEVQEEVAFNQTLYIENLGTLKIIPNTNSAHFNTGVADILVVITSRKRTIDSYKSRIQVEAMSEYSSILSLSISDPIKLRAENILDELIKQYNLDAVIDKNVVSNKTKDFIEERLQSVGVQLGIIQDSLRNFKTNLGISGTQIEGEIALNNVAENDKKITEFRTRLSVIQWVQQEIHKNTQLQEVLPANLGFSDAITSQSVKEYNELILLKLRMQRDAGAKNPEIITLTNQINLVKQSLQANFNNLQKSIEIQLAAATQTTDTAKNKIASIPGIERGIIDIQRQKLIYGELYSYLLKKKEELAISLAITVPNAKIIDVAYGSDIPISPKKSIVYLIALVVGLVVPFAILYLKNELDSKIHYRNDLEKALKIPYLGDIPHAESDDKMIIKKDSRTSTAEAFRLLRTNLYFMLPKTKKSSVAKTIFVTSTISGEGKSFVSINLAAVLALTHKKVLLIGMDLRAPTITAYLGMTDKKGITNYILDDNLNIDAIKLKIPQMENVDFICSGLIPPNPAELLLNDKVSELFEAVKKDYDYIVVDTAPVSLVSDTLMIAEFADMFLYVARANHLEKRMLIVPETLYREKKLPNMAMLLNDTDSKRGYGYGYGYVAQEKKSRFKRFLGV
ncbi:MAG: chain length determinant protein [Flavobacteriaceae bacterium CG2_30_31_66]|nr:MAG: chain length determinant protein [Flavobacteriaceae bacterium CG2_30_31_66]